VEVTSTGIKAGTMVSTGVIADAIIFSDVSYFYLAIVGALVSGFGVIHHVYGQDHKVYSISETVVEIIKGVALGLLAIPFWYIVLTSVGDDLLIKYFGVTPDPATFTSLSLIISFGLSWFTVPIFDFIAKTIPGYIATYVARIFKRGDVN